MKTSPSKMKKITKSEGEDVDEVVLDLVPLATLAADPNIAATSAPSPYLALFSQNVKLIKDQQNKHTEQLEFMEKLQLEAEDHFPYYFCFPPNHCYNTNS